MRTTSWWLECPLLIIAGDFRILITPASFLIAPYLECFYVARLAGKEMWQMLRSKRRSLTAFHHVTSWYFLLEMMAAGKHGHTDTWSCLTHNEFASCAAEYNNMTIQLRLWYLWWVVCSYSCVLNTQMLFVETKKIWPSEAKNFSIVLWVISLIFQHFRNSLRTSVSMITVQFL